MIFAILRAQLLSMRPRAGAPSGGAVFSAIAGLMFYGLWALLGWGALTWFADPRSAVSFVPALSTGLLFVMLYWQLTPVLTGGFGASLDIRKLLVYPIPRRALFTVEVLLRLTGCAEMSILVACAAIGLLRNPLYGWKAAPFILAGALLFIAANVLISAGTSNLFQRMFRRSRLKEVMMFLIAAMGIAPRVLFYMHVGKAALLRFAPSQLVWPWAAAARLMLRDTAYASAGVAILYVAAAWSFGRWQFERTIRSDPGASIQSARSAFRTRIAESLFRFPAKLLRDPLGALIEKELRTFARIPRFRLVYVMSCFFGLIMYLPLLNRRADSFLLRNALPGMSLYGLLMLGQISYWNSFGFDRSAVQGYFSWPIRFRDALLAKNVTLAILLLPQIAAIALIIRAVRIPVSVAKLTETVAVILIASLYWFAMGNICSVRIPRPMDPDKMNQISNKLQALSIFAAPLLLLPVGLAYWARAVFENQYVFAVILLFAAIVGAIVYRIALDSAEDAAYKRRESMLMQLSRSEGPLSAG